MFMASDVCWEFGQVWVGKLHTLVVVVVVVVVVEEHTGESVDVMPDSANVAAHVTPKLHEVFACRGRVIVLVVVDADVGHAVVVVVLVQDRPVVARLRQVDAGGRAGAAILGQLGLRQGKLSLGGLQLSTGDGSREVRRPGAPASWGGGWGGRGRDISGAALSLGRGFRSLGRGFRSLGRGFRSLGRGFRRRRPVDEFLAEFSKRARARGCASAFIGHTPCASAFLDPAPGFLGHTPAFLGRTQSGGNHVHER